MSSPDLQRWPAAGLEDRRRIEAEEAQRKALDKGVVGLDGFKIHLRAQYGNLLRAWKLALDTSGDGKSRRARAFRSTAAVHKCGTHARFGW